MGLSPSHNLSPMSPRVTLRLAALVGTIACASSPPRPETAAAPNPETAAGSQRQSKTAGMERREGFIPLLLDSRQGSFIWDSARFDARANVRGVSRLASLEPDRTRSRSERCFYSYVVQVRQSVRPRPRRVRELELQDSALDIRRTRRTVCRGVSAEQPRPRSR